MKKVLLVIDPQNDFMDDSNFNAALPVSSSYDDMLRLANHIVDTNSYDQIVVTLDTHKVEHIAHSNWWINENGQNPEPFTVISLEDIKNNKWFAANFDQIDYSRQYVEKLESMGKYKLMIWPNHCIEDTEGWKVTSPLSNALKVWEASNEKNVMYVKKGQNSFTEMYSGFKAEVEVLGDDRTKLNDSLIKFLASFDQIDVAGEAMSHCVASSVKDLMNEFHKIDSSLVSKICLIKNAMSPVSGADQLAEDFLNLALANGVQVMEIGQNLELNKKQKLKV